MARYPQATWHPMSGGAGAFLGGPFRIVLHTTEGSSVQGALAALKSAKSDSHFVAGDDGIVQLIDTSESARSLQNAAGGVQTNRLSAIQIEMVGDAARRKSMAMLSHVRRLCRWIEREHGVPHAWPAGLPMPMTYAEAQRKTARPISVWSSQGGYYGHSQVPENSHWDPALAPDEVSFLMADEALQPPVEVISPPLAPTRLHVVGIAADDFLNLRAGPSADAADIGDLPLGQILDRLSVEGDWSEVRTPLKFHGWVRSKYVQVV